MPWLLVPALPFLVFLGIVGMAVSLARGRPRHAVAFGIVGVAALLLGIALYYGSL